jgi:Zn-dependent protease with chaperone function
MASWVGALITSAVLNGVCQGLLLTALVWLAIRALPGTAATRYAVWSVALVAITALPLVLLVAPAGAGHTEILPPLAGGSVAIVLPAGGAPFLWPLGLWALVSLLLMARVIWSYGVLERLKHRAYPLPAEYQARFDELQRRCPGRRRAALLASDDISTPVAAGLRRPAVVVPGFLVEQLSEAELAGVLTHELAHLRRGDDWTNLLQRLVEAVAFFHPAVQWIGRRLSLEREIACDDWVVALTGTTRPYAACLAKLAAIVPAAAPQLAPGVVPRKPQISVRVEALLANTRSGKARCSKGAVAIASAVLSMAAAAVLSLAPVAVAEMPAPALSARTRVAPAPAFAYAAPKPPRAAVATRTTEIARVRKPAPRPGGPAVVEEVTVAVWRGPAAAYYVVCASDGEPVWIQVVWIPVARTRVILDRT